MGGVHRGPEGVSGWILSLYFVCFYRVFKKASPNGKVIYKLYITNLHPIIVVYFLLARLLEITIIMARLLEITIIIGRLLCMWEGGIL